MRISYTDDFYLQAAISRCPAQISNPHAKPFTLKIPRRQLFLSKLKPHVS
jgi:hypothetical protein